MEIKDPKNILKENFPETAKVVFEKNWIINNGRYDQEAFGNAFVEMISKIYNIRVIKDRGQFFIGICRPPEWHDLRKLLGQKEVGNLESESEVAALLRNNITKIPYLLEDIEKKKNP